MGTVQNPVQMCRYPVETEAKAWGKESTDREASAMIDDIRSDKAGQELTAQNRADDEPPRRARQYLPVYSTRYVGVWFLTEHLLNKQ